MQTILVSPTTLVWYWSHTSWVTIIKNQRQKTFVSLSQNRLEQEEEKKNQVITKLFALHTKKKLIIITKCYITIN